MGFILRSFFVELLVLLATLVSYYFYKAWLRYKEVISLGFKAVTPYKAQMNDLSLILGKVHVSDIYREVYHEFNPEKVIMMSPQMDGYMIRDPDYVNRVLIKDFSHFHDRGFKTDPETNPLDGHLFSLSGEKWRVLRNKLSPTFTSGKLKAMFPLMEKCCDGLIQNIEDKCGQDVEALDMLACFTTDVIGSCAFGLDVNSLKNPNNDFRTMGKRVFRPTLRESIVRFGLFLFPSIALPLKLQTFPDDIHNFFTSLTKQAFEQRLESGERRNDFLQLLLELREKGKVELDPLDHDEDDEEFEAQQEVGEASFDLTDEVLTAQVFVFFVAGFETSATSMSFTLYLLAKNPETQKRAREEIKTMKDKHKGITYAAVKEMKYLNACFSESMRLFPPIKVLFRECTKTYTFPNGLTINKGCMVAIPSECLQKDPEYFENPEEFQPERLLDQDPVPCTFLPFGDGPRLCIGQRFAQTEAVMGLAKIMDNFQVSLGDHKNQEPFPMNPRSFVTQPEKGIWVRFDKI